MYGFEQYSILLLPSQCQLRHMQVLDSQGVVRDIMYTPQEGYAIVEGDIILAPLSQDKRLSYASILKKLGGYRWKEGIVPFQFSATLSPQRQLAVLEAMSTWEKVSHIRFVELSPGNSDHFLDYLLFLPSDKLICSSSVGRQGGPQTVILGPHCAAMNVAHELGHALGLWHEQSRNDRDQYIQILWENIDENYRYNFNQHIKDGEDFGEYDYFSIMHYSAYSFSKNGQPTIIPLQEGVHIGQREYLSAKDIAAINAMYP